MGGGDAGSTVEFKLKFPVLVTVGATEVRSVIGLRPIRSLNGSSSGYTAGLRTGAATGTGRLILFLSIATALPIDAEVLCCFRIFEVEDEAVELLPLRFKPRMPPEKGFLLTLPELTPCWKLDRATPPALESDKFCPAMSA